MTKAEAIKELKMMLMDNSNTGDMYNALKMAVEALSELNNNSTKVDNENDELVRKMDDLKVTERKIIYLDDAIDVIENYQFSIEYCKEHNIDRAVDVSMTKIALEALPSAQPEEVIPHRNYKYLSDYWCECGWHLGKKGEVKYCAECGKKVKWDG